MRIKKARASVKISAFTQACFVNRKYVGSTTKGGTESACNYMHMCVSLCVCVGGVLVEAGTSAMRCIRAGKYKCTRKCTHTDPV